MTMLPGPSSKGTSLSFSKGALSVNWLRHGNWMRRMSFHFDGPSQVFGGRATVLDQDQDQDQGIFQKSAHLFHSLGHLGCYGIPRQVKTFEHDFVLPIVVKWSTFPCQLNTATWPLPSRDPIIMEIREPSQWKHLPSSYPGIQSFSVAPLNSVSFNALV